MQNLHCIKLGSGYAEIMTTRASVGPPDKWGHPFLSSQVKGLGVQTCPGGHELALQGAHFPDGSSLVEATQPGIRSNCSTDGSV